MEEYEESFNFGETIVEVAKEKQRLSLIHI